MISQSTATPLIAVVGATGGQGGSVIKELIASDKPYRIRGLTRDASKPVAQNLAQQGVEMVSVSLHAENEADATKAFEGASIVFAVTQFWEHLDKNREVAEGKMMVDAALAAGVILFVWSGLVSFTDVSGGKYTDVHHFDGKADITKYANARGLPLSVVPAAMYMSNFESLMKPSKQADGSFVIGVPCPGDSTAPLIDTLHDYGIFVRAAIENPEFGSGSIVCAYGEILTWNNIAKQISEVSGKDVKFAQLSEEQYMKLPFPTEAVAREMMQMHEAIDEFGYFGDLDLSRVHKLLCRKPRTFKEYVTEVDWSKFLV